MPEPPQRYTTIILVDFWLTGLVDIWLIGGLGSLVDFRGDSLGPGPLQRYTTMVLLISNCSYQYFVGSYFLLASIIWIIFITRANTRTSLLHEPHVALANLIF